MTLLFKFRVQSYPYLVSARSLITRLCDRWVGFLSLFGLCASFWVSSWAQASPIVGQGTWQTSLQARDLNGDGVTDAFYDTDLNITWLRDANVTRNVRRNGANPWDESLTWVAGFEFGGYSDWRLPNNGPNCFPLNCTQSEMGHLYYVTLGNLPLALGGFNSGDFQHLGQGKYWTQTPYAEFFPEVLKWNFNFLNGRQEADALSSRFFAMAVRDGDVRGPQSGTLPEPASWLLVLMGLLTLQGFRLRCDA